MRKVFLVLIFFASQLIDSREMQQTTFSYWNKPDVEVFYSAPSIITSETKILFIMHGASRNAKGYLSDWLPLVEGRDVVLIAPKFSKEFYPEYLYLMKSNSKGRPLKDSSLGLESSLGLLFDFFSSKLKVVTPSFRLYGHSGGSQFVHRYLLLSSETRIDKAAMANAGFYTFANPALSYPFGIKGTPVSHERIEWFLALKGGVFLGDQDNDPKHHSLPSMRKAKKQGKHRFERGTNFFNDLVQLGIKNKMPFRWRYQVVPMVAHNNAGMSLAASEFLLEDL